MPEHRSGWAGRVRLQDGRTWVGWRLVNPAEGLLPGLVQNP